jgi:cytochrome P450
MPTSTLPGPRGLAQLGPLRRLFLDPQPVLDELSASYGPVVGLGAGPVRMAVVGSPVALRELFATPTDSFRWGHRFNVLGFVVGDQSLIVSDGADHRRRRGAVQAAFSVRRLQGWVPMIVDQVDAAVERLVADLPSPAPGGAGATTVDLYPVGRRIVLEVAIRAFFGARTGERAVEIGDLFQRPQDYLESNAVHQVPHPFPHTARSRVRADRRALDAIVDEEIAARRADPGADPLDLLDAMVAAGDLSDAEIRDQVVTLIGAGYDTTAATLAWVLWHAALAPGWWEALRAEADAVLGAPGSVPLDHTVLPRLVLADRVVRESLRLNPAGVIAPREAAVDVEVDGYRIRRGTLVLWSAHLAGRDPSAWPDPLRFDPGRFADLTPEQQALADDAWVPFGRGPRRCIGFALAQMELTLALARLVQRLDVEATGPLPRPVGMVVNRPTGGVPLRVRARAGDPSVASSMPRSS